MTARIKVVALLLAVIAMAGCRSGYPVYNVDNLTFDVAKPVPMEKIERAIIDAGTRRGWTMKRVSPGLVEGSYSKGGAMALVGIAFTSKRYSITYKESENLSYDGSRISNHYNSWVKTLSGDIHGEVWAIKG